MNRIRPIAAALALFFSAAANASLVTSWTFTGTGAGAGTNGSLTFTARLWDESDDVDGSLLAYLGNVATDEGAPYVEVLSDFYVITSATGTINGNQISLMGKYAATETDIVDPETGEVTGITYFPTSGFAGNDNVLLEPNAANANNYYGYVTKLGVSFVENCTPSAEVACRMWKLSTGVVETTDGLYVPQYQLYNSADETFDGTFALVTTEGGRPPDAVPIPAAAWLFLSGVGGLFMAGRRRSALARAR